MAHLWLESQKPKACIIPLALGNSMVPLLLEKQEQKGEPCYRLTICNGGNGVTYHRQSARSPPKLKFQTCRLVPSEKSRAVDSFSSFLLSHQCDVALKLPKRCEKAP